MRFAAGMRVEQPTKVGVLGVCETTRPWRRRLNLAMKSSCSNVGGHRSELAVLFPAYQRETIGEPDGAT